MVVGQRVRVAVIRTDEWNAHFLKLIQGKSGRVVEIKTHHNSGRQSVPIAPRCLVEFDTPTEPTWSGSPSTHHWFDGDELAFYAGEGGES